ncbi:hypothetical protein HCW_02795 [Helicobacter cetorum MIT 00-7128]|uniref:Uncharacterized protein n=1 Tax=Helicobacter cetorum (strain ATCC BAA-429 / MIT 00-7128) TaxID=182217 RepID=I0ELM1_HELC0|nr:hypothetical protein HCW_02795 [Helicobacter cetorum MIT 00-7128]
MNILIKYLKIYLKDKEMYKDNEELAKEYMRQQTKRTLLRVAGFLIAFISLCLTCAYIFKGF